MRSAALLLASLASCSAYNLAGALSSRPAVRAARGTRSRSSADAADVVRCRENIPRGVSTDARAALPGREPELSAGA
mgnify:CR=1 FL=1